jgi:hypothetical protein
MVSWSFVSFFLWLPVTCHATTTLLVGTGSDGPCVAFSCMHWFYYDCVGLFRYHVDLPCSGDVVRGFHSWDILSCSIAWFFNASQLQMKC